MPWNKTERTKTVIAFCIYVPSLRSIWDFSIYFPFPRWMAADCSSSSLDLQAIDLFSLSWCISLQLFSHPPLSCLDSLLPYFDDYHANILIPWPFAYWLHLPVKPPTLDKPHDVSPLNLNSNGTTVNSCSHIPLGSPQCSAILPRFPTQFASLFPTRAILNFLHCP